MLTVLRSLSMLLMILVFFLPVSAQAVAIDPTRTGTITLNFAHPNIFDDVPAPSPAGVGARVQRVSDIDLSTRSGWSEAASLTTEDLLNREDSAFDVDRTGYSNESGTVTFSGLPLGLYRITPLEENTFVPFILALPSSSQDDHWEYIIDVHPKVAAAPLVPTEPGDGDDDGGDGTVSPGKPTTSKPLPPPPGGGIPGPGDTAPGGQVPPVPGEISTGGLASTGANVLGFIGAGILLLFMGAYLTWRTRRSETMGKTSFNFWSEK